MLYRNIRLSQLEMFLSCRRLYTMILLLLIHTYSLCRVEPVLQFPAKGLTKVLLFLNQSDVGLPSFVLPAYKLAIFHVFLKSNAHFQTFQLVYTCHLGEQYLLLLALTFRYKVAQHLYSYLLIALIKIKTLLFS